jgi:IPT/TIG domain
MPSTLTYTYVAPVEVLAVISGQGGTTGGDDVTVIGDAFQYGATVTFGGNAATNVVVVDINTITCTTPAHAAGTVDVVVTNTDATTGTGTGLFTYSVKAPEVIAIQLNYGAIAGGDQVIITGKYFVATPGVLFGGSAGTSVVFIDSNHISCISPAHAAAVVDITVTNPDTQLGVLFNGYTFQTPSPFVDTKGWWYSDDGFSGGTFLALTPGVPKHPRHWDKIAGFATGNAGVLGGSPACSVVFNNHIIYAGDDYTVSSSQPTIRIFDGISDRLMTRIPNTSAAVISQGIMSMLLVNGIVYLTTFDSGTNATNWAGRVFSFDPLSNTLTQIGADFTGGHLPYALAFHKDWLWLGTNKGNGTAGKVYFFRPNIDSAWTLDEDLTASSVGGVDSMASFNGLLYVGTDNAAAAFAKVLVRADDGTFTTSLTATGGTARVNNGFLSMRVYKDNLYTGYWNEDTTAVAKVYKFDGSSWTTVYTGSTLTLRPYIVTFFDNNFMYVIGGGRSLRASLIRTTDGTTWTNLTYYLAGPITETALPIYGVVYA